MRTRRDPVERFFEKVQKTDGCWLWTASLSGSGYGQIYDGEGLTLAHRFSYSTFVGDIPADMVVMHNCDNKLCVNPSHLQVGTVADNMRDMYSKGRGRSKDTYIKQSGERAYNAVLTNEQAQAIREEYSAGVTSSLKLAAKYGVGKTTILDVLRGVRYVH